MAKSKNQKPQKPQKPDELDELVESDKPASKSVEIETPESEIDLQKKIQAEVQKQFEGLQDKITEAIQMNVDPSKIVDSVLIQIEEKNPVSIAPKWVRLNPQTCYEQCMNRALDVVTSGQTRVFMQKKGNCKALMNQAIKLANSMFDSLAEEFEIAS